MSHTQAHTDRQTGVLTDIERHISDLSILVTGNSPAGDGGMFCVDKHGTRQLDSMSTMGAVMLPDGTLARLAQPDLENHTASQLYLYDDGGLRTYHRIDGLLDPHGMAIDSDGSIAIASTLTDEVQWIDPKSGTTMRIWWQGGTADASHLNCLYFTERKRFACAFGRFLEHREWKSQLGNGTGVIIDLDSGENVLTGLDSPHDVLLLDDEWIVCNSGRSEVARFSQRTGRRTGGIDVGGWSRGMALAGDLLVVGVSSRRASGAGAAQSQLVLIDVNSWSIVERIPIPVTEIFSVVLGTNSLARAIANEDRQHAMRLREQLSTATLLIDGLTVDEIKVAGRPLSNMAEIKANISAEVPSPWPADTDHVVNIRIDYLQGPLLTSAPPCPVNIGYRWSKQDTASANESISSRDLRTPLTEPLRPGDTQVISAAIASPNNKGKYRLEITLVQESVAWISDQTDTCVTYFDVEVA